MGLRFRKSIKIAPGVKMNIGKKSVGISVGTKGARMSINSSGRRTTSIGVPGTGLSYVKSSGGGASKKGSEYSSFSDEPEEENVNYDPSFYRQKARNVKINSITFRITLIVLAVLFLILGLAFPVCFVLCALCIVGFVRLNKKWKEIYEEATKEAEVYEAVHEEMKEIDRLQKEINEADSLPEVFFLYEQMEPVVEAIRVKTSAINPEIGWDTRKILSDAFEGKVDDLMEEEYRSEFKSIGKLKTQKGIDGHIQRFQAIFEGNMEKLTDAQKAKLNGYRANLERIKDMIPTQ
ncbi:MAG: DUF4236 domain-containing protein [Evtepia gabavorous]|uniref:DUF4236 domain-containing protein n=1 Tax=Evtepia gabavorous TaxID=2211183 RepID=UPI00399B7308